MSHFNEKTGEIEMTEEERETLRKPLERDWAQNIINKIIWGEVKEFYDKTI